MRGLAWNTGERSVTRPRDVGFTSAGPKKYASSVISPRNSSCRCSGPKMNWRSGAGRSGLLRRKVQPSPTFELSGPLASASYWAAASRAEAREHARLVAEPLQRADRVVLEVLADGQVLADLDAHRGQVRRRADAGEHEQLRGVVRAPADEHLALRAQLLQHVVLEVLDADRPVALEQEARRVGVRDDVDVAAGDRGAQVRRRRAAAAPVADRELVAPGAVLHLAVVVVVRRHARLDGRGDHRVDERVQRPAVLHARGPPTPW